MLFNWIHQQLNQRLEKKKQEVIRLRWQKAQMEQDLKQMKKLKV